MKGVRGLLLTLLFAGGLLALGQWAWNQRTWFLARQWANRLDQATEPQVDSLVQRINELGEPAIPILVEALGSDRDVVARSAKAVIWDEMERWRTLPADQAWACLTTLAHALAGRVDRFGPEARGQAAALATRILQWPANGKVVGRRVVADCERVLRAVPSDSVAASQAPLASEGTASEPAKAGAVVGPSYGGLAVETAPLPESSSKPSGNADPGLAARAEGNPGSEPKRLIASPAERSQGELRRPWGLPTEPGSGDASEAGGPSVTNQPARLSPIRRPNVTDKGAGETSQATGGTPESAAFELMRRLHTQDPAEAAEAAAELKRCGLSERDLILARQLFHPDPQVRRRLARSLPQAPGIDAALWLVQLGQDEDPEVRLTALTLLATTGDPALSEQVRRLARTDPDERVQRLAERLAPQPSGRVR